MSTERIRTTAVTSSEELRQLDSRGDELLRQRLDSVRSRVTPGLENPVANQPHVRGVDIADQPTAAPSKDPMSISFQRDVR